MIKAQHMSIIPLEEYGKSKEKIILEKDDIVFINEEINKSKGKESIKVRINPLSEKKFRIEALSYAGVIQLPSGYRIEIHPKIFGIPLFHILSYLHDIDVQLYEKLPYLEGNNYLDIIALLFKSELEKIINQGLYGRYVRKINNLDYLRGKLLVKEQLRFNYINKEKFFCNYEEFSYDNLENQTIFYVLFLLIQLVRNKDLLMDLLDLRMILESIVTLKRIQINEVDKIVLTRLNDYYETIIELSKLIIQAKYIEDITSGEVLAFSFLIDMNKVFERFIFKLIKEIYKDKIVEEQQKANNLLIGKPKVTIIPDIILKNKETGKVELVIDTKYKKSWSNDDFYQVISYGIAHNANGLLIYPKYGEKKKNEYQIKDSDKKVFIRDINLQKNNQTFESYINHIKLQLKDTLNEILIID